MEIRKYVLGPLNTNSYLVIGPTYEALMIDAPPGSMLRITYLIDRGLIKLTNILITHAHFDHVAEAQAVKEISGAKLIMGEADLDVIPYSRELCKYFGVKWFEPFPDIMLRGDGELDLGWVKVRFIHTPGHTPGSMCYYLRELGAVFTGDVLFKGTVGRTDLPLGSRDDMLASVRKLIEALPKETKVLPGHGRYTTIKDEVEGNPFVRYVMEVGKDSLPTG